MGALKEQAAKVVEIVEEFYREANGGPVPDIVDTGEWGTAALDQQLADVAGLSLGALVNSRFAEQRLHKDRARDGAFGLHDSMYPAVRYVFNLKALREAARP